MSWNKIPSWFKGGIILLTINLILVLPFIIFANTVGAPLNEGHPTIIMYFPSFLITDGLYWGSNTKTAVFIFSSIFCFIVGVIIGWIIGKIKRS